MKDDNSGKSIVFIVDDDPLVRDLSQVCFDRSACRRGFSPLRRSFCRKSGLRSRAVWCSTSGYPA